jgi:hypothetical protein
MTAPWAGRSGHTSVIDARTRAIYVIGGTDGTYFNDVWASTDGGAQAGLGGRSGGTGGTQGARGVLGCSKGCVEYSRGGPGVPEGHPRGTRGLPWGTLGTHGVL